MKTEYWKYMRLALSSLALCIFTACTPPAHEHTPPSASQSTHHILPAPDLLPPPPISHETHAVSAVEVPTLTQTGGTAPSVLAASAAIQAASQTQAASAASSFQTADTAKSVSPPQTGFRPLPQDVTAQTLINQAEHQATGKVRDILQTGREMTLVKQEIIPGGCWDYLNEAWNRAGVPAQAREVIYADKINGPYAHPDQLQAGDWIYHVNHSYNNMEHSGMFIGWLDKENKQGLTLSYAGEGRQEPARYRVYDLSGVYQITRVGSLPKQPNVSPNNPK